MHAGCIASAVHLQGRHVPWGRWTRRRSWWALEWQGGDWKAGSCASAAVNLMWCLECRLRLRSSVAADTLMSGVLTMMGPSKDRRVLNLLLLRSTRRARLPTSTGNPAPLPHWNPLTCSFPCVPAPFAGRCRRGIHPPASLSTDNVGTCSKHGHRYCRRGSCWLQLCALRQHRRGDTGA